MPAHSIHCHAWASAVFPSHAATSAGERVRLSSFSTFMQMAAVTTSELSGSTDAKRNFAQRWVSASISWSRRFPFPSSASSTIHETCDSHGESVTTRKRTWCASAGPSAAHRGCCSPSSDLRLEESTRAARGGEQARGRQLVGRLAHRPRIWRRFQRSGDRVAKVVLPSRLELLEEGEQDGHGVGDVRAGRQVRARLVARGVAPPELRDEVLGVGARAQ